MESQTYQRWQMVLVVGGQVDERATAALHKRVRHDPRIETITAPEHATVARVTNVGIESCRGEFLTFLDQDDELAIDALYLAASRLDADPGIDYLYADQDRITANRRFVDPLFRPSPSMDLMLSTDIISSPLAVRLTRVVQNGGMREGLEGAHDHDLALRLMDAGAKADHLSEVAHHRRLPRESPLGSRSTTSDHAAGLRAVSESVARRGISATVRPGVSPGQYEILFRPAQRGSLGIVVLSNRPVGDIAAELRDVVRSTPDWSVHVVVVRRIISHDGTVAEDIAEDWPEGMGDLSGVVTTYRGWPNRAVALNQGSNLLGDTNYLLFMDDQVRLTGPQLGQLLGNLDRPDVGAVGPTEIGNDGRIKRNAVDEAKDAAYASIAHDPPNSLALSLRDVPALSGSLLLTKTSLFRELGGFPPKLGNHLYDVAYCTMLRVNLEKRVVLDRLFAKGEAGAGSSKDPKIADYEDLAFRHLVQALTPKLPGDCIGYEVG